MRQNRHAGRKRLIKALALLCCVSMLVGSFAFFTDRVSQDVTAKAGNIDLVFTDISASTTGENLGVKSNNEFAQNKVWSNAIVSGRAVINPGDFFDLSYALMNTGNKSIDVRQQLVLTCTRPMTSGAEEYQLTITGGPETTAVTGIPSADRTAITYNLQDITLNGSVELEDGALADPQYTVRLDFLLMAANKFAGSGVTVTYKAMAKQHRNTTDEHWVAWAEYETKFDQVGEADPETPVIPTLTGDGQVFNKSVPRDLTFISTAPASELQDVIINGSVLAPANYKVSGEDETRITLTYEYLQTLPLGVYEIYVTTSLGYAPSATFTVTDSSGRHESGLVYGAVYGLEYTNNDTPALIGFTFLEDGTFYQVQAVFEHDPIGDGSDLFAYGSTSQGQYTYTDGIIEMREFGSDSIIGLAGPAADGSSVQIAYEGADVVTATITNRALFADDYFYIYSEETNGYYVNAADRTKTKYAPVLTGFYGRPTIAIVPMFLYGTPVGELPELPETVTAIGINAFANCTNLKSATLPDGVEIIGAGAFAGCTNLTSVEIPDSVTLIDEQAFQNCTSLQSVELPDGLKTIGDQAFRNCSGLTSIVIPDSVTDLGNYTFYNCVALRTVVIGNGVPVIASQTFYGCDNLRSVEIRSGIIDAGAFNERQYLNHVVLGDGVTAIGSSAFSNCDNLTEIEIPGSVTSIGSSAFYDCDGLTSVVIANGVETIGNLAFEDCNALTGIEIPDSVTSIGDRAFQNCTNLTSIVIPDSVTSIGNQAFYQCSTLERVEIQSGTIGEKAFYGCSSLTAVDFGADVSFIDPSAFNYCPNLSTITVSPDNPYYCLVDGVVYTKDMKTLVLAPNLRNVVIPTGVETIGDYAFAYRRDMRSVEIPSTVTSIGANAFYDCDGLTSVTIPGSVATISNYAFAGCSNLTSVEMGSGVKTIGDHAFSGCSSLTSIEFPDGLTFIGEQAFYYCWNLEGDLVIPDSVETIGSHAFHYCVDLESVVVGSGVTTVGWASFSYCSLDSVVIRDGVKIIDNYAFNNNPSLKSIVIPASVTTINQNAFSSCNQLTDVYYTGTEAQWNAISIDTLNDPLLNATKHYEYAG